MTEKTQKTRSHTWLILSLLLAVALIVVGFVFSRILEKSSDIVETNPVAINAEFYNEDGQKKITADGLKTAIDQQKSFVLFVSYPICSEETAQFKEYVREFQEKNKVSFYYITTDDIDGTVIKDTIKYFPTVAVFEKGEIKNYLRFDSDEDLQYYKSIEGFSKWFYANVKKD